MLISFPKEFAIGIRLVGLVTSILFAITTARMFWGEQLLPTSSPLPFFAYPFLDLSARSKIIRDEPFHVHFWECTPREFLDFLKSPRKGLAAMGIDIPVRCRIETTIENHDWIEKHTKGFTESNGTIVCNIGGGNVARTVYRVISYGHDHSTIGKFKKKLLHSPEEESRTKR